MSTGSLRNQRAAYVATSTEKILGQTEQLLTNLCDEKHVSEFSLDEWKLERGS